MDIITFISCIFMVVGALMLEVCGGGGGEGSEWK